MLKVLVAEKIAEEGIQYLKDSGLQVDCTYGLSKEELLNVIENYDGIIVRSATKVIAEVIEKGKNLKVIGRAGNGIDNIDVPAATKKGIMVVNTPESNIMAAAELAVAMAYCSSRNIAQAYHAAKNNDFRRSKFVGNELDGKTAGIIGLGRIGSIVATKLKGANMKVIAFDPYVTDDKCKQLGVEKCETLEELLKNADLITLHTPKIAGGSGIIGEAEIRMCKKGVRFVNCARGGLVNEKALYEALKDGHVASAAIDVLDPEPNYTKKPEDQDYRNQLLELDNVTVTPHLGASTEEATYNVGTEITKLVAGALKGEMVAAVNMPPLKSADLSELKPYIDLADILGKIYYQTESDTVKKIEITYSGDLADKETKVISLSVIKGFLEIVEKSRINYVNAELALKNMGIEMVESKKSSTLDKYTNLITVKFVTNKKELSVSGTVFTKDAIRIVDFFGYKLDFEPSPYVIAIQNIDKPGIIGKIGTILGANDINIAAMQWSRNKKGDKAVSFVSVDCEVSDSVLDMLRKEEGVLKVSMVKL